MTAAPPGEVELKYRVRDGKRLIEFLDSGRLADLEAGPWRTVEMEDRYVDTSDRSLARAGYAARLRRTVGGTIISLKALDNGRGPTIKPLNPGSSGAMHRRAELEGPATPELVPDDWPESPARAMLTGLTGGAPIEERFTVRQLRRERELRGPGGWAMLSLDEVEFHREGQMLGRADGLEIELRGGEEQLLESIARTLEASGLVDAEPRSKEEIAQALVDGASDGGPATPEDRKKDRRPADDERKAAHKPIKTGKSPGVTADDTLAEAGRKVLRFHLARMLAREEGTRAGDDVEELHGMRVATRRMRAAWRVFEDSYRPKQRQRYVAELRGVARALGTVRDLDVLLDGLDGYTASRNSQTRDALEPLADAWRRSRDEGRASLMQVLDSADYTRFVDDYFEFVHTEAAGALPLPPHSPSTVRDTAGSRLWAAHEHVRAYDAGLAWADVATLHELRIEGKRLRYTLEFFKEVLGPEAGSLIEQVTQMQDHLGLLHDADVAAHLARDFLVDQAARPTRQTMTAVGRYLTSRERETARLRRTFPPLWRQLTGADFRRRLAASISAL
ncbi:MAG: CHAD domain-containing protein [Chloroflexi bacterium]|nr:CHAD domain-containing protein [Chloroflexota bacterium]